MGPYKVVINFLQTKKPKIKMPRIILIPEFYFVPTIHKISIPIPSPHAYFPVSLMYLYLLYPSYSNAPASKIEKKRKKNLMIENRFQKERVNLLSQDRYFLHPSLLSEEVETRLPSQALASSN